MSLTPKNWKSFQHYNQRRPPWIKLHRALLDDMDFDDLPDASQALAWKLWLIASEYDGGTITLSNAKIAKRLRLSESDFAARLQPLLDIGYFLVDAPPPNDIEPQASSASGVLAETRKHDASNTLATEPIPRQRRGETETETEKHSRAKDRPESEQIDLEEAIAAKAKPSPSRFDDFWQAYPRREGPNPRQPAEKKFNALVKSGADPEMMIAAARKLAADESARGNIGTRFIPQAITWLNQQRWSDHAAVAALVEMAGAELPIEKAVKMFAQMGFWSRHAGPSPGQGGCRASDELLAKYGLAPDGRRLDEVFGA